MKQFKLADEKVIFKLWYNEWYGFGELLKGKQVYFVSD